MGTQRTRARPRRQTLPFPREFHFFDTSISHQGSQIPILAIQFQATKDGSFPQLQSRNKNQQPQTATKTQRKKRHSQPSTAPTRRFKAHQQNGLLRLELQVLRTAPPSPRESLASQQQQSCHSSHTTPAKGGKLSCTSCHVTPPLTRPLPASKIEKKKSQSR